MIKSLRRPLSKVILIDAVEINRQNGVKIIRIKSFKVKMRVIAS